VGIAQREGFRRFTTIKPLYKNAEANLTYEKFWVFKVTFNLIKFIQKFLTQTDNNGGFNRGT